MEILEAVERLPSLAVAQEEAVGKVLVVVMVDKVASGNMVLPLVV